MVGGTARGKLPKNLADSGYILRPSIQKFLQFNGMQL